VCLVTCSAANYRSWSRWCTRRGISEWTCQEGGSVHHNQGNLNYRMLPSVFYCRFFFAPLYSIIFMWLKVWNLFSLQLWNSDHGHVLDACKDSLKKLQLDYLDLYLIHFPVATRHTSKQRYTWWNIYMWSIFFLSWCLYMMEYQVPPSLTASLCTVV